MSDKAQKLAARIKHLALQVADAQADLEAAKRPMWIQIRGAKLDRLESELHKAVDELAELACAEQKS